MGTHGDRIYGSFGENGRRTSKRSKGSSSLNLRSTLLFVVLGLTGFGLCMGYGMRLSHRDGIVVQVDHETVAGTSSSSSSSSSSSLLGGDTVLTVEAPVQSCVGLTFHDGMHSGKQVCRTQECAGVVYVRYVDVSTFACSSDPSLLQNPCDISKCPNVGQPPPLAPPPLPGRGEPSSSGSPLLYPKVPLSLLVPLNKSTPLPVVPETPTRNHLKPNTQSTILGGGEPQKAGFTAVKRASTFAENKKLWGPKGQKLMESQAWPTHAFWENLILGQGMDTDSAITVLPYIVQATQEGLVIAYPSVASSASQSMNAFDLDAEGIRFEALTKTYRSIVGYSELGVDIAWSFNDGHPDNSEQEIVSSTSLVQGDPYVTMNIGAQAGFRLSSEQTMILVSRGDNKKGTEPQACDPNAKKRISTVTGSVFDVYLSQSDHTYRLYTFPGTTITCPYPKDVNHTKTTLTANGFEGTVRLALHNNCTTGLGKHCFLPSGLPSPMPTSPEFQNYLDAQSHVQLKGGHVSWAASSSSPSMEVSLQYEYTQIQPSKTTSPPPMILLLPHQVSAGALDHGERIPGSHRSMIGPQIPIVGSEIRMTLPMPDNIWGDQRPLKDIKVVQEGLDHDKDYDLMYQWKKGVGDPYNAGKLNARIGRLALIANQLNETEVTESFLDKLEEYQGLWLSGKSPNPLVYDEDMGGVVSCGCNFDSCEGKCTPHCANGGKDQTKNCPTLGPGAFSAGFDFGNGYYNDHHFHYGYHLYATAVLARFRPKFIEKYKQAISLLVRDVANPNAGDKHFPMFRHMDFYIGHSWAGGVYRSFANGRNQESTSEAVNCWYAIALLGDATGDKALYEVGMTLLAMEVHGAQTYWQNINGTSHYDPVFADNGVTGILWSNLAQFQTWFGLFTWAVNGIQMLPFTPISEYLIQPAWVKQQIKGFTKACSESAPCKSDGWSPLVCMALAMIDQDQALKCTRALPKSSFSDQTAEGNGNSLTNTLHFIMSRP